MTVGKKIVIKKQRRRRDKTVMAKSKVKRKERKYAELGVVYTCLIPNNMTAMTIDLNGNITVRVLVGGSGPKGLCKSMLPVV